MTAVTESTGLPDYKKAAAAARADRADKPGAKAAAELASSGALDELFAKIDSGEIELTGDGGFIPGLIKATLERGLQAELTDHLGYEKGDPAASAASNSRNGTTPKNVATQVGDVDLAVPRDREGSFSPTLVPKGSRRLSGLDEMIISLYAGGMTVRDIAHHLESTIGTELSHETISNITDAVAEEILEARSSGPACAPSSPTAAYATSSSCAATAWSAYRRRSKRPGRKRGADVGIGDI